MNKRALLLLLLFVGCTMRPKPKSTVLFVCPYGGAKSVIAASYFNRIAQERGLPYTGVAASAEEPYEAVPAPVVELLARDGFDVHAFKPRRVDAQDMKNAAAIVTIDCKVEADGVQRWDDVPKVSVDLAGSAAAIRRHVEALAKELP